MNGNVLLGRAAELRVASELLLRGHEVFLSLVDDGADLVMGSGLRLQVKAARRRQVGATGFSFSFHSWRKRTKDYAPHPLAGVDFVILWCVEANAFYVIPAERLRGQVCAHLGETPSRRWGPYREAWNLLG